MKKQTTPEELAKGLNACVELSLKMLLAGTLIKNVKAHWLNNGFNTELTDSIVKKAENIFNTEYSHYRAK